MTDYKEYINALRKCAKEHEKDRTYTGHIIVSDLCRDTANLLERMSDAIPKNLIDAIFEEKMALRNRCQYKSEEWKMFDGQLTALEEIIDRWRKEE